MSTNFSGFRLSVGSSYSMMIDMDRGSLDANEAGYFSNLQSADAIYRFVAEGGGSSRGPYPTSMGRSFGGTSSAAESSVVASRCSVRNVHEMVSKLGTEKASLVRSIGFGGILHIPNLKQINLRFSTWLMSRVDETAQTLRISDHNIIHFSKHDVARVFGIPDVGVSILGKCDTPFESYYQSGESVSFVDTNNLRSIKSAQSVVSRVFQAPMTEVQQDEFKAAFVVVVMAMLLAPCAKHDRVCDDYMHVIERPAHIARFDWAEYVIRRLLDAVSKLKVDIANNVKVPYIYGCSLFLQVLYLDSIDLGVLSMPHNVFPRIRKFTSDRIRSMISAVASAFASACDDIDSPKFKLRNPDGVCYYWGKLAIDAGGIHRSPGSVALWDAVVRMTRTLKIPVEASGPLFVAAVDCQRQIVNCRGFEVMECISVFINVLEPYVNGFRYQPSAGGWPMLPDGSVNVHPHACIGKDCCNHISATNLKRKYGDGKYGTSFNTSLDGIVQKLQHSRTHSAPMVGQPQLRCPSHIGGWNGQPRGAQMAREEDGKDFDSNAINAMARFYLLLRPVKPTRCSELNAVTCSPGNIVNSGLSTLMSTRPVPRSPWELGEKIHLDSVAAADVRLKLSLVGGTDEPWIVHYCPKYIEVRTLAIKSQFGGSSEFELELVDACIRRFKQLDDVLYANEGALRWRHFVESNFMVSLMAGCFDIDDPLARVHFCSRHISYDITKCQLIFFPVMLQYRWVCLAWRMHDNTIVVYDPCSLYKSPCPKPCHYRSVVDSLRTAMSMMGATYFSFWENEWDKACIELFTPGGSVPQCTVNHTGLLCLYFCRYFDGERLIPPLTEGQLEDWSALVLLEVSALLGNLAPVPPVLL